MDTNTPQPIITETARPVASAERIKTIDIVRGVALLGILLMNIPDFGSDGSIRYTVISGPHDTADFYTIKGIRVFFQER